MTEVYSQSGKHRSIRIFHVLTNLDLGGAQTSVALITGALRRRGIDVSLVYSSRGGRDSLRHPVILDALRNDGVPVHDVDCIYRDIRPLMEIRAFFQLQQLFARWHPDVVHTHMSKAGILGRLAAHACGVPIVIYSARGWSFHDSLPRLKHVLYTGLERMLARETDRIVAVSGRMIEDGLAEGIGNRRKYQVIRTGIDTEYFISAKSKRDDELRSFLGVPKNAPVVGTVMGLTASKSPLEFLDVCKAVLERRKDVHVVVVGDGEMHEQFEAGIDEIGANDRIHMTGLQSDVRPYLAMFNVFLLTSRWEGLPRVVLEALTAGIPVVGTDVGGMSELQPYTDMLLLEEPGAIEALAHAVILRLDAMNSCESCTCELPSEFHLSEVVESHMRLYRKLAERKGLDLTVQSDSRECDLIDLKVDGTDD